MSETTFCDLSAGIQHVPFFRNVLDSSECFDSDQETPNKARLAAKRERAKQRLVERENAMLSNIVDVRFSSQDRIPGIPNSFIHQDVVIVVTVIRT